MITVNLTVDEARAVADAMRVLERSEHNELILGPVDWDDLRLASNKIARKIDSRS